MFSLQAALVSAARSVLCGLVLLGVVHARAANPLPESFDIGPQKLATALNEFARQSQEQILFAPNVVTEKRSSGVKGTMPPLAALEILLKGSGLGFATTPGGAILVGEPGKLALAPQAETAQGGDSAKEGKRDSSSGFRVAQSGQGVSAETASLGSDATRQDASRRGQLEEILVTAQKRAERLEDVPVSVSVLGSRQMLDLHQTRLVDYAALIPGLQVDSTSPGNSTLTLRGLALAGDGATVGTYIDDVPVGLSGPGQNARGSALELLPYDLERVEVLRGPQGTFYGANALGGLLKYVTKTPDLHRGGLSLGTDLLHIEDGRDGYTTRIAANQPLVEGKLAVRGSYGRDYTPGYIDIPGASRRDVNKTTRQTGNVALLWQATDRLSLKLAGLVDQVDSANNANVRLSFPTQQPVLGDLQSGSVLSQPFRRTGQLYSATLKYDFGWSELTSVSSFASSASRGTTDATVTYGPLITQLTDGTVAAPRVPLHINVDFRKYTQEIRLATPSGARIEAMLGSFFTYEDAYNSQQRLEALSTAGTPVPELSPLVSVSAPTTYQEEAVFGNVTYKLTERFDISAGVRLAKNRQKLRSLVSGPLFPGDEADAHSSQSVFNYSVAPRWRIGHDVMAYVRVATGYRPGGPNIVVNVNAPIPRQFKSDRIINYEAGLKSSLFAGRVDLNVAAYQINWTDVQLGLVDFTTQSGYFDNGKRARSRGVEWEGIWRPLQPLKLGLAASWIEAVLTDDVPQNATVIGRAGDRLPSAPRFTGSATVNYGFPLPAMWSAALGGTYRYVGRRYTGLSADPNTLLLESYSTIDLNAGATNDSWSVNLFVRNLANKRAYLQENLFTDLATNQPLQVDGAVLQPRMVGVSIDKRF